MYEMSELQHLNKTISLEGMGAGQTWGGGGCGEIKEIKNIIRPQAQKQTFPT
jgi:hypothetical protein